MVRTKRADSRWRRLYVKLESEALPGLLGEVTERRAAQLFRLSLLFAALDGSREVTTDHLLAGLAFWRYCEASAAFIFGRNTGHAMADKILVAMRSGDRSLTRSQVWTKIGRNASKADVDAVWRLLLEGGFVEESRKKGKGRTAALITLV
jgi:hypothetical protein